MMSAKLDREVLEAHEMRMKVEEEKTARTEPYTCIDCGWKGPQGELGGWLGFFVGFGAPAEWEDFCPKCGEAGFLVSGAELDAMNKEDDACKLSHPLSCRTNS